MVLFSFKQDGKHAEIYEKASLKLKKKIGEVKNYSLTKSKYYKCFTQTQGFLRLT